MGNTAALFITYLKFEILLDNTKTWYFCYLHLRPVLVMGQDNVHGQDIQDCPIHGHGLCNVQDIYPWTYIYTVYPEYYIMYPIFEMQYLHEFLTNPSINWYIDRI